MAYRSEVQIQGNWHSNGFRFETREEAAQYAVQMKKRWKSVSRQRVTKTGEIANCAFRKNQLKPFVMEK